MNNIEDKGDLEQLLNDFDDQNFYLIEEEIDIKIQNKYFKQSRATKESVSKEDVFAKIPSLSDTDTPLDTLKDILIQLASLRDVEAYRVLEKHCRKFNDDELNIWSVLAYNEARMILNGALKDKQQVFISTGMGGKNGKFRYFVVFFPDEDMERLTQFSKEFVTKELDFTLKQNNASLEETIEDTAEYISYKVLIPFKADVQKLFTQIMDNCNQLKPFISDKFILTNVGEMNKDEIKKFLEESDDNLEIIDDMVSLN